MYTLDDLYNRLDAGTAGVKREGAFDEPDAGPAGTMHNLNDIMDKMPAVDGADGATAADVANGKTFWGLTSGEGWGKQTGSAESGSAYPAPVARTGQTICYNETGTIIACADTGQDGDELKGVTWPNPRFTDNGDGTVTDNLTGLVWLQDAACMGTQTWTAALTMSNALHDGCDTCGDAASSDCGLADNSQEGDWRLPNRNELLSLVDIRYPSPALSNAAGTGQWTDGDPFGSVTSGFYWSASTYVGLTSIAWYLDLQTGGMANNLKTMVFWVWPVRDGQSALDN